MYEPGSIAVIPFPYSDLTATKRRPVLILTQPDARGDFVAMPITSKQPKTTSFALSAGPLSHSGNLPLDSWIKTNTAFSLSTTQIIKALGRISDDERIRCIDQLCQHLRQQP